MRNSLHWGLNPGPSVYKTDALPLSYGGTETCIDRNAICRKHAHTLKTSACAGTHTHTPRKHRHKTQDIKQKRAHTEETHQIWISLSVSLCIYFSLPLFLRAASLLCLLADGVGAIGCVCATDTVRSLEFMLIRSAVV